LKEIEDAVKQGVTVIVCSHNGASRLPQTLSHLKLQKSLRVPWEVLLIDSASTDNTAKIALSCWEDSRVPLRVVQESKPGFQRARERGLKEAQYEFLAFVDDDNWLAPDWIQTANAILASDPSIGALGSVSEPSFEVLEPEWFRDFHSVYAILTDSDLENSESSSEYLHGAGICIRRRAWTQLLQGGFHSLLTDRVGGRLSGSGDKELTLAIRLSGWSIRVDPRLRLKHFIPADRLRWAHLRRLQRGQGASQALLDSYSAYNLSMNLGFVPRLGQLWWCQAGRSLFRMMRRPRVLLDALTSNAENQREVIEIEQLFGRLLGMVQLRRKYGWSRRHVRYAPWRLRRPEEYFKPSQEAQV
jgi:cellulose synthase/poly-beta-1,6-N-acetylglucosamine synthase-like glycosyltransferase